MKISWRPVVAALGLLLLTLAFWQVGPGAEQGLKTIHVSLDGIPVTFIGPSSGMDGSRPLVLIGHGFAGSTALMRSFALPLAHAGYVTALWDFDGHGANPNPLTRSGQRTDLNATAEAVLAEAQARLLFAPGQVAILGHSMGSVVALRFGLAHPDVDATIAVSPGVVDVTPSLPRNLLLMAGENEAGFVRNAQSIFTQAGGSSSDFAAGTARKLVIIPWVEHISILFHDQSHVEARTWLDAVFGVQPGAQTRFSRLIGWYGLGILGALLAALTLAPPTFFTAMTSRPLWLRLLALLTGSSAATLLLVLLGSFGLSLGSILGVQVGGFLVVWFAIAGLVALILLRPEISRVPGSAAVRPALAALVIFVFLWLGVGLLGSQVWVAWLLIPARLLLWGVGAVATLPWMLAVGLAAAPARGWGRVGWWFAHSLLVLLAMVVCMQFISGLGFLILILPLFPVMLALHALAAGRQGSAWVFGLSGALFLSWLVMAVFPL
jgi:pimeloyl-ACP methyl ester carboxylesterase